MKKLTDFNKIHFVGIGGVGMSALAKYARHHGITVTGSDAADSEIIKDLEENYQTKIFIGSDPLNIDNDHDAVVYSPAIPESNQEYQEALNRELPMYSYPQMLGTLTHETFTIAVSGTNGKTTTTSMIIESMKHLGMDPTAIVGAQLQKYTSNFISGSSDYLVVEACEYKNSFLSIAYDILVITNITEDHLDYFKDLEDIQKTFITFLSNKKGKGIIVCNTSLANVAPVIKHAQKLGMTIIPYEQYFETDLSLPIPGEHNKQNFAAALGVIEALGQSIEEVRTYLGREFKGAKRRMEFVGMTESGSVILDDYAHNPEGLEFLIEGMREFYPNKKIIMLFEPHLYSRTRDFKESFGNVLSRVDILYLFPTYRAREQQIHEEDFLLEQYINTDTVELITVKDSLSFVNEFKAKNYTNDYIIISAGAGDIWKVGKLLKKTSTIM